MARCRGSARIVGPPSSLPYRLKIVTGPIGQGQETQRPAHVWLMAIGIAAMPLHFPAARKRRFGKRLGHPGAGPRARPSATTARTMQAPPTVKRLVPQLGEAQGRMPVRVPPISPAASIRAAAHPASSAGRNPRPITKSARPLPIRRTAAISIVRSNARKVLLSASQCRNSPGKPWARRSPMSTMATEMPEKCVRWAESTGPLYSVRGWEIPLYNSALLPLH